MPVSALSLKSLTELRGIAQSMGVKDIFQKDVKHLAQEILTKQQELTPPPVPLELLPPYDARLMTKPPAKRVDPLEAVKLIEPYIKRGLKLEFSENGEHWTMRRGPMMDTGTTRMPMRNFIYCAQKMME